MTRYLLLALTFACLSATAHAEPAETLPSGAKIVKLQAQPPRIELRTPFEYSQLLLTAQLAGGERLDVTRLAKVEPPAKVVRINDSGAAYR